MPLQAALQLSFNSHEREAGSQAASQAVASLGRQPIAMAWVMATQSYNLDRVKSGVSSVLGSQVPLMGCSTSGILASQGRISRGVGVVVLGGRRLRIAADWWPDPGDDPENLNRLLEATRSTAAAGAEVLLVVGDGLNGSADFFCQTAINPGMIVGSLAGGSLTSGRTFQIGGRNSGSGGLAVAWLPPQLRLSSAVACGWTPVGEPLRVDRVEGLWLRTLNGRRPSELLAELFGFPARQWAFPPLDESIRQYPLGLELEGGLLVRSPLRIEADGSLRMNATIPVGSSARIMVGSPPGSLQAATKAAQQALDGLQGARALFGLLLVDTAWQSLLEAYPGAEIAAVRKVLGQELPILGGYGFGQIAQTESGKDVQLLNQHLELVLFGAY